MSIFLEITLVTIIAVIAGFAAHVLRQPTIVGFILAGLAVGLFLSPDTNAVEIIEGLAPIGVALLLFLVGLEMNIKELRAVGLPAFLTGLGQLVFTFAIGFFITQALGFSVIPALYISLALTFSSTIIVVKLLSEKRDLKSLYGRIVVGFLLVQDFVAILALIFLSGLQKGGALIEDVSTTVIYGGAAIAFTFLAARFLPRVIDKIARSQEMLYLFSIAWALGIAALSEIAGLSIEVGGFLAGLALAHSSEHYQIGSRLRPLRDFFLILFFVVLGVKMLVGGSAVAIAPAVVLSLFVLIGNPLIVMLVMGALGYRRRTSFLASLTVAQISEFSLIIAALGLRLGHLKPEETGLVTLIGIITIFVSSYFIMYGNKIYKFLRPVLRIFEFRKKLVEETATNYGLSNHIVLVGVHRTGKSILGTIEALKEPYVALDFDPVVVKKLKENGVRIVYGDASDEEIQEIVGMETARLIISTMPESSDNMAILKLAKKHRRSAKVIVTADDEWHARALYDAGADYVLVPNYVGGREIADIIGKDAGLHSLKRLREKDLRAFGAN